MCFMGFNFTVPNADRYVSFKNLHDNRSGDSKRWKLLRPYTTRSLPDVQLSLRPTKTFTEISFQFFFCLFYFISWVPSALNRFKATIQAIHCCQFDKLTYLIGPSFCAFVMNKKNHFIFKFSFDLCVIFFLFSHV